MSKPEFEYKSLYLTVNTRQWLVKRFDLWKQGELEYTQELISKDVRNNSAWNHRFFIIFGRGVVVPEVTYKSEMR